MAEPSEGLQPLDKFKHSITESPGSKRELRSVKVWIISIITGARKT